MRRTKTGLEVLVEQKLDLLHGRRIGFVTNHSAVNSELVHAIEVLKSVNIKIQTLFAPEHGIRGDIPAGREVPSGTDPRTGIPVCSLYGKTKQPPPEILRNLDVVLFDIQDVGCRFYTYAYTLFLTMQACARHDKQLIILDRPNPVDGQTIEGNVPEKHFASPVGSYPIPIRHGMTLGELANFFNSQFMMSANLSVITCQGWKRYMYFDETGLPWVMPSPNLPTPESALIYSGLCFLEGTNVSEGRGTSKPFELAGAPWINAYDLANKLNSEGLKGVRFRPVYFTPFASKFAQQQCAGVQVHVLDLATFQSVAVGLQIVKTVRDLYPKLFKFLPVGNTGKLFFDYLAGTDKIRLKIESGCPVDEFFDLWHYDIIQFMKTRKPYLLYM